MTFFPIIILLQGKLNDNLTTIKTADIDCHQSWRMYEGFLCTPSVGAGDSDSVNDLLKNILLFLNGYLNSPLEKLVIEPTNFCNRACFFCGAAQSITRMHRGYMEWDLFIRLADEAEKIRPSSVSLHAHGEPLLHPRIAEMVKELTKRGLVTEIVTNGDFLTPELSTKLLNAGLNRLVISHPAISPDNWQECRDEPFSPAIDARIKDAIKIWQGVENGITLRCLVFTDKVRQKAKDTREYIRKWIVTPGVRKVEFWRYQPWPDHVLENEIKCINRDPKICSVALQTLLVSWKGEISPCSFDIHGELVLGTYPDVSLQSLYNSKKMQKFRRETIRRSNSRPLVCKKCLVNRVPVSLALVDSNEFLQTPFLSRDEWIEKTGEECWTQLTQEHSLEQASSLFGTMYEKISKPFKIGTDTKS
jgi:radical SAM protein with 4Fe4S-binding SPASM domain